VVEEDTIRDGEPGQRFRSELFVSEQADQFVVQHAQASYYDVLLEAGVRIPT
jgi:hypothetical protein